MTNDNIINEVATCVKSLLSEMFTTTKQERDNEGSKKISNKGSGFGDLSNDTDIKMDEILGNIALRKFKKSNLFERITIEGFPEEVNNDSTSNFWVCVDPLDGSLNYKTSIGSVGLPYAAAITVLNKSANTKFKNIVFAGIIDLRTGDTVTAIRKGKTVVTEFNGVKFKIAKGDKPKKVNLKNQIIIGENYYFKNRELLLKIFHGQDGWLRSPGSAAYEMMLTVLGVAKAIICCNQRQHELGAGYLLMKGAGGVTVNFELNDLSKESYKFNAQTPYIFAASMELAKEIYERMTR